MSDLWDLLGKIFRGHKKDLPPNLGICESCGCVFPKEDLHQVVMQFSAKEEIILCDDCVERPPSTWIKRHRLKT